MDHVDDKWLERKIFFRDLTPSEKESLPRLIQTHTFKSGERVHIETRGSDGCIYLLRSGSIKLIIEFDDGTTHEAHLSEGAQIGDLAFIDNSAKIMMEIIEEVVAYSIYRASLANFFIFKREVDLKPLWPKVRMIPRIKNSREISFNSVASLS